MSYEMNIGVSSNGAPLIGAAACREYGEVVERVYPSQFAYRCTFRRSDGTYGVDAPSRVPDDCEIIAHFPPADHSRARRI